MDRDKSGGCSRSVFCSHLSISDELVLQRGLDFGVGAVG